ncbi:MAG: phosphoribosylglycinamide formyltransferase [Balneolaceae bacterium]|nr:phosphoribosylglycinamide formyltransferase [Balneolaceae bacterium]
MVLASGSGSNFQAIIDSIENKRLHAEVAGLIAGKPGIGAIERAKKHRIPVKIIPPDLDPDSLTTFLLETVDHWKPDLIVLAGFLKKIPGEIVDRYPDQIINIHPSLLPKYGGKGFYGIHVHKAVIESGDPESGCTVHYVNEKYDDGSIIEQRSVPVLHGDTPETLAARVLKEEHSLLPEIIKRLLNSET